MTITDKIWLLAHSKDPEDRREWAVLYWKSQGLKHKVIADKWQYSEVWVQRYMTHAYKRFNVPQNLNKYQKLEWLEENVFPALREFVAGDLDTLKELPPPPEGEPPADDLEAESPEPPVVEGIPVDSTTPFEADSSIQPVPPKVIVVNPQPAPSGSSGGCGLMTCLLIVILGAVGIGGYFLWRRFSPSSPQPTPQPAATTFQGPPPMAVYPTYTPYVSASESPIVSTVAPTTASVPPANGILFQDNFDNGISPEWKMYGNDWLTSNGQLTLSTKEGNIEWAELDHPDWTNYEISVDVTNTTGSLVPFGYVAIAVRQGLASKTLGVLINEQSNIYWSYIGENGLDSPQISGGNYNYYFLRKGNVEITAQGRNYTLRVDGKRIQTISLSGYDSGGIGLGIQCDYVQCPSFDNLKVTYLP